MIGYFFINSISVLEGLMNTYTVLMMLYLSRGPLVRGGKLVLLGLLDHLEDQVLKGLQDLLERREFL